MHFFRLFTAILFLFLLVSFTFNGADGERWWRGHKAIEKDQVSTASYNIPATETELDSLLRANMDTYHVPGLTSMVIRDGEVIWKGNFGMANIAEGREINDSTVFQQPAVSVLFTETAILQLWEQGKLQLDDDINNYLPDTISIHNPSYPETAITFRQIMMGTSTIISNWDFWRSQWGPFEEDKKLSLSTVVESYFDPQGNWYRGGQAFDKTRKPGEGDHVWGNPAYTLLAYMVQVISGTEFRQYCAENIFEPLKLKETTWRFSEVDKDNFAMCYDYTGNGYTGRSFYGHPLWPTLMLLSSPRDMCRFAMAFVSGGELEGARILQTATIETIEKHSQINAGTDMTAGLVWYKWYGSSFLNGMEPQFLGGYMSFGIHTGIEFCRENNFAMVAMTNTEQSNTAWRLYDLIEYYGITYGEIYAPQASLDKRFVAPDEDQFLVTTQFINAEGKDFDGYARFVNKAGTFSDSLLLFDDGAHGDGDAGDGLWGNIYHSSGLAEEMFDVDISTHDKQSGERFAVSGLENFTTIGPVQMAEEPFVFYDYSEATRRVRLRIRLENKGKSTAAQNLTVKIATNDARVARIYRTNLQFPDLAAGAADTSVGIHGFYLAEGFNLDSIMYNPIDFTVTICSDDVEYWYSSFDFAVGVEREEPDVLPGKYMLFQNYPNPFNPISNFEFRISKFGHVNLSVYNILGQKVATLVNKKQAAGIYTVQWDASGFGSGVYIYMLETDTGYRQSKKLVLLK